MSWFNSSSFIQQLTPGGNFTKTSRVLKLVGLLVISYCVMAFIHESGHIVCGVASGGTLTDADLLPWHLPHSFFDPDPYPLVTLWGGPILGVMVPVVFASAIRKDWSWFIANFCLLANGSYVAMAWIVGDRFLDTPKLLENGASPISIAIYCVITIGCGYIRFRRSCKRLFNFSR